MDEIKRFKTFFDGEEGDRRYARLLRYAKNRLRRYQVGGKNLGLEPVDVVNKTIQKVLEGTRTWNPEKHSDIEKFLMNNIDSVINHSFDTVEAKSTERFAEDCDGEEILPSVSNSEINDHTEGMRIRTPEELVLTEKEMDEFNANLLVALAPYPELEDIAVCIMEGKPKPQEIAEELDISVQEVNNRKKRLTRLLEKLYNKPNSK